MSPTDEIEALTEEEIGRRGAEIYESLRSQFEPDHAEGDRHLRRDGRL